MKKGAKIFKQLVAAGDAFPAAILALRDKEVRKVCNHVFHTKLEDRGLLHGAIMVEQAYRTAYKGGGK